MEHWLLRSVLGLLLGPLLARTAFAHEERDPVCGMMVDVDTAQWRADYAGKTYYFCMASEVQRFLQSPEKYVSFLRSTKILGQLALTFTLRPREPRAGEAAKCYVTATKPAPNGMSADDASRFAVREGVALIFHLDRTRPPAPRRIRFQPMEEPHLYGLAFLLPKSSEYRVRVEVTVESLGSYTAHFDFLSAGEASERAHGGHEITQAESSTKHLSGAALSGFSMEQQHETMRLLGRRWTDIGQTLFSPAPNAALIQDALTEMDLWQRNMKRFSLHKYHEDKREFDRYAGEFDRLLSDLQQRVVRRDWEDVRNAYAEVDGRSCTKCHLKFRWGVVEDLSRFPDLRRLEYAASY